MLLYATLKVTIMCPLINKVHLDEAKNEFNNVNGSQTMDPTKKVYLIKKNEWKKLTYTNTGKSCIEETYCCAWASRFKFTGERDGCGPVDQI